MAEIPIIDSPRVQSAARPGYSPRFTEPNQTVSKAFGALSQAVGGKVDQLGKAYADEQEKARKEAAELAEANALLEQQRRAQRRLMGDPSSKGRIEDAFDGTDSSKGGYLTLKGLDAFGASGGVSDALEKDRQEIAETIADPRARASYMARSGAALLALQRQVNSHANQEFEGARIATMKARADEAIGQAEAGIPDLEAWQELRESTEEDIRRNSRSPEEAEANVRAFNAEAAAAVVRGLVATDRADDAAAFIDRHRTELANKKGAFLEAQTLVNNALKGKKRDVTMARIGEYVTGTADRLRNGDGLVEDPNQIRELVKLDDSNREFHGDIERMVLHQQQVEEKRKRDAILGERNNAHRADLDGQPIPGVTLKFLEKYDPEFLLARRRRLRAEAAAEDLRQRRGSGASNSEQNEIDKQFRYVVLRALAEDPNANVDDVLTDFINTASARLGRDVAPRGSEIERARATGADRAGRSESKEAATERSVARDFEQTMTDFAKQALKRGQKVDEHVVKSRVGQGLEWYREALEKNGGKPLDAAQLNDIKARMTSTSEVVKEGLLWNTKSKVPTIDLAKKKVKSYLVSPDRTQRQPRYEDGTLGPVETGKW